MTSDVVRRRLAGLGLCALAFGTAVSCGESLGPLASVSSPVELLVQPVGMHAIRISWQAVNSADVSGYRVERRTNLQGAFEPLPDQIVHNGSGLVVFIDTDVEPETYYGYRVVALTRFGERSGPSVVGGARTPPPPGIRVVTSTSAPNAASLDPDGYQVTLSGPDTASATIGLNASKRFAPLAPGAYTVALTGVHAQCAITGPAAQQIAVTDTGLQTLKVVNFAVACRDPSRGDVVAVVDVQGDSLPTRYDLTFVGLASDATLPDSARIVNRRQSIQNAFGGSTAFTDLRPGSYEVALDSLPGQCVSSGPLTVSVDVAAGATDTVAFALSCDREGSTGTGPYEWINSWQSATAATGARVRLRIALDFRSSPSIRIASAQGEIRFDPAVLRFESYHVVPGGLDGPLWNPVQSGVVAGLSLDNAGLGKSGLVPVVELEFTVLGGSGTRAITRTTVTEVVSGDFGDYRDSVRVIEGTLQVGSGGGGTNQSPVAEANGPYAGTVGTAIAFSAAGSTDPDGSIASYTWAFGDGSSGSGAAASHSYAAAGTYTVTLTVADNQGATGTDQATVTVTAGGGGSTNQPPVPRANGPYTGTAESSISFSAAGSSDPDGSITSYQWTFGDGGSASGASVSHTYQAAGTYTATLTVTDDRGATASAQATVTVTAVNSQQPFTWSYSVAPPDGNGIVAVTITYDLRTNIPETPNAESLQQWAVQSLRWDPAVMQYFAFNFGPGGGGSVNPTNAGQGQLAFSGSQPAANSSGIVTIATIRFRLIGAAGSSTTTQTTLGPLLSAPANGGYNYAPRTRVIEGTIQR
jgi:PKD repeat protein